MTYRVHVDRDLCAGYSECQRTAGAAFEMDDGNQSVPTSAVSSTAVDLLLRAARQCPTNAISVSDESGAVIFASAS